MSTLISAAFTAALVALLLVALGALFGRLHPLLDLAGQFVLPATIAAALLILAALIAGRYAVVLLAVVALLANGAIAWPWAQDTPAATEARGPSFKLLLFNVFVYNPRLDRAVNLVRASNADVVVLLEIVPRVRKQLDALAEDYPYRLECWQQPSCDVLVLSRFPLTDVSSSLPSAPTRRSLAATTLTIEGRTLTLFSTHLSLPFPFRRMNQQPREADDLATAVASVMGARVLVGDFNAATWGASVAKPRERADLQILTGAGGSWPSFLPRQAGIPIDHVLATHDLVLVSRKLMNAYGSDHRAVLTEIAFKN